ncbi:MAG: VPLPA-CTERM sorting domain-containing protein [Pseudomonadota bacterium]
MFLKTSTGALAALLLGAIALAGPAKAIEVYDPTVPGAPGAAGSELASITCSVALTVNPCQGLEGEQDASSPYDPVTGSGTASAAYATGFALTSSGNQFETLFLAELLGYTPTSPNPTTGLATFDWWTDLGGLFADPPFDADPLAVPDDKLYDGDDIASGVLFQSGWYLFKWGGGPDFDDDTTANQQIDTAFIYSFGIGSYNFDEIDVGGLSHVTYLGGRCIEGCGGGSGLQEIPLPAALPLMGAGLAALAFVARRRQRSG